MKDDDRKPHEALEGLQLGDGWTVLSRVHRGPELTGGHFSCGYIVEHSDGRRGFLKALDFFSRLAQSADPARALEPLIKAFNFERDLLRSCRRMSRIVTAYTDGAITVPGFPPPNTVQYIIFELADGDIRSLMITSETFDVCLALRALREIAIGLRQLHTIGVAHQDVNPSNVLRFQPHVGHKLADL
jgi:serine/threonine protein kinase